MTRLFRVLYTILIGASLVMPLRANCLMSSADYIIYADSVSSGGGLSTGGNYSLQDTIGEASVGISTGASYEVRGGYQYMVSSSLSFTISSANLDLGILTPSAINSNSTVATISTDCDGGYALSVDSVSGSMPAAVADGAVTAGSEEYGFAVSGFDSAFVGDSAVSAALVVSSSSTPVMDSQSTLTFKASISTVSFAGNFSQAIILAAAANL